MLNWMMTLLDQFSNLPVCELHSSPLPSAVNTELAPLICATQFGTEICAVLNCLLVMSFALVLYPKLDS